MNTSKMREIYGFKRRLDLPAAGDWYMVECVRCHKVIKGSGLGIGSHRRACKGFVAPSHDPERDRLKEGGDLGRFIPPGSEKLIQDREAEQHKEGQA